MLRKRLDRWRVFHAIQFLEKTAKGVERVFSVNNPFQEKTEGRQEYRANVTDDLCQSWCSV